MTEQELNDWWLTLSFDDLYIIHNVNMYEIPAPQQREVYNNLYNTWLLFSTVDKESWYTQLYTPPASLTVISNSTDIYTSTPIINNIISLTQIEYDAITTKDINTLYVII